MVLPFWLASVPFLCKMTRGVFSVIEGDLSRAASDVRLYCSCVGGVLVVKEELFSYWTSRAWNALSRINGDSRVVCCVRSSS